MPDTMGSLAAEVTRWLRGDFLDDDGQQQIRDSINNGLESIWNSMMLAQLSKLMGPGPVNFTLASGTERVQLVSIVDPVAAPTLSTIIQGALPLRTYTVSYTFVTESGSETLPSPTANITVPLNSLAQVTAPTNPGTAWGWNVYAGQVNPALQNQNPIPFGVVVTESENGWQDYPASEQLPPTANTTADNIAYINHLEITTPDNTRLAWNQNDIDSAVMRRLSRTYPVASPYQLHGWDLINGTTLEFRPKTGIAYTPRYFYVSKPRRIAYDTVDLPYQNIIGIHEFIVAYAMELCSMGLEEGGAASRWAAKAKEKRMEIILSLNQEGWAKNTRVSPYLR